ncbi:MAG: alginate export family protein [Bacteroidota bacterium]|nr:alginate export family protein [Bacteroidota bacterium]
MKKKMIYGGILALLCSSGSQNAFAQFSLSGQLRTRTELRDGQGAPLPKGATPAFFTSQRTRLNLGYNMYRLKFGLSVQDVRVWGQDVSTINRTTTQDNNGVMLHEAWAELALTDTTLKQKALSLKLGSQELVYDDQRLLGNLDWLQQGRRHDAALLKWETPFWMLHFGTAFNQNKEANAGIIYNSTPPGNYAATTNGGTMYKSMQFLYAGRKLTKGTASFLFFTDQFSKYRTDTINRTPVKTFEQGAWSRATTGIYVNNAFDKITTTASAYYQFGKTAIGQKISSYLLSASAHYLFTKNFSAGAGVDYTSGGSKGGNSKAFDPLYGTPHKFWGLMDYFYVASPFGKGGLVDYYLKTKFKASEKISVAADLHQFNSATRIALPNNPSNRKKNFGQELDVIGNYSLTKQIGIEAGYAHFFATSLLTAPAVKNIPNARNDANWAYVMINIKPEFLIH